VTRILRGQARASEIAAPAEAAQRTAPFCAEAGGRVAHHAAALAAAAQWQAALQLQLQPPHQPPKCGRLNFTY